MRSSSAEQTRRVRLWAAAAILAALALGGYLLAARLVYRCFELGLLVIYCGLLANVIEMTPPLTLAPHEADEALAILEEALADVEAGRFDDAKLARFQGW